MSAALGWCLLLLVIVAAGVACLIRDAWTEFKPADDGPEVAALPPLASDAAAELAEYARPHAA